MFQLHLIVERNKTHTQKSESWRESRKGAQILTYSVGQKLKKMFKKCVTNKIK